LCWRRTGHAEIERQLDEWEVTLDRNEKIELTPTGMFNREGGTRRTSNRCSEKSSRERRAPLRGDG
jgi:hypothetical protein